MLAGDDVINVMGKQGRALRQAAVFAGISRSPTDGTATLFRHAHDAARWDQISTTCRRMELSRSLRRTMLPYSTRSSGVSAPALLFSASSSTRPARSWPTAARAD